MTRTSSFPRTSRIENLQSLRFFFILMVFASHIDWNGYSFDYGGECGVSFFFILSGFVLSAGYSNRINQRVFNCVRFFKRQTIKIYPLHLLTMTIVLALNARIGQHDNPLLLFVHLILLQSWLPDDSYYFAANSLSWFLSDIMFFYLMFPFLYRKLTAIKRKNLTVLAIITLAIWLSIALSIPEYKVNAILYASPALRLIDFAIGIIIYRAYNSRIGQNVTTFFNTHRHLLSIAELMAVATIAFTFFVYEILPTWFRCTALFWLIIPAFILLFTVFNNYDGCVTRVLQRKWMLWLGSISFEIYMTHCIVMRVLQSCVHSLTGEYIYDSCLFCTAVPLTIVASYVTKKYFVDKIANKLFTALR